MPTSKTQVCTRAVAKIALALIAATALGACERRETLLTVHASAATRTAPDLAIVTLGVVARGATARAAQEAQSARMNAVMAAVRAAGVEASEVQTVGFSLDPQYVYRRGQPPRIGAYQSRNVVAIRVSNLEAVSGLIDAAVADGANELQGIQFTFQDDEASRDAARAKAVETARARADAYAAAAHMRVARVVSITEPGGVVPPWEQGGMLQMRGIPVSADAARAEISAGELDSQSSVTVVFELR